VSVWMLSLTCTKSVRKPLHVSSHVLYLRGQDNCERAYSGHKAVIRHFHGGQMDLQLGGNLKHKSIRSLISVIDLRLAFPPFLVPLIRSFSNDSSRCRSGIWNLA
jgi:hypothetical protein